MVIWTLAKKDLRLLLRDPRALIILLFMPLSFILVLGAALGENFGKPSLAGLRVSVLDLDEGVPPAARPGMIREGLSWLTLMPSPTAGPWQAIAAGRLAEANYGTWFPREKWSQVLLRDLNETADIRVEFVKDRAEATRLVETSKRPAVLIIGKEFSRRVERCSFLKDGLNPFFRDGVNFDVLDIKVEKDETQQTAAAIIDQVAQGSLLRIVMPWMIGRAFEKIGDPTFLKLLGKEKDLPGTVQFFLTSPIIPEREKQKLGSGLQSSLQNLFPRYNLTAKTWAALTKEREITSDKSGGNTKFHEDGAGILKRGGSRYQLLVPSSLVMFAFFLVLTVGWLFVAERRQGTMKRLIAAPITKAEILLGKMLPCLCVSLFQGYFLLGAGKLLFGMTWGPEPLWLIPLVAATSLAAMGLAMFVAALAQTETQVAIYGTLLVLVLAMLSGALLGDRSMMPQQMQTFSLITPHAWALDAYRQLLTTSTVYLPAVQQACLVLAGFGVGFLALAWWFLKLDADR